MFSVSVVALLCLVSVSLSASLPCEVLVQPLGHLHHLEGSWALVAGSMKDPAFVEGFKRRDSASVTFFNTNRTSNVSFTREYRFGVKCRYFNTNISVEGSSFTMDQFNVTMTVLYTSCADCVVMRFDTGVENIARAYLFSRRREVEQKEMEEYEAQMKCLMMPPPVVMDPSKELCPEQSVTEPAAEMKEKTDS